MVVTRGCVVSRYCVVSLAGFSGCSGRSATWGRTMQSCRVDPANSATALRRLRCSSQMHCCRMPGQPCRHYWLGGRRNYKCLSWPIHHLAGAGSRLSCAAPSLSKFCRDLAAHASEATHASERPHSAASDVDVSNDTAICRLQLTQAPHRWVSQLLR